MESKVCTECVCVCVCALYVAKLKEAESTFVCA